MSTRSTCFTSEVLVPFKLSLLLYSVLSAVLGAGDLREREDRP